MRNFLKGLVALLLIAGVAQAWNLRQRGEGATSWERNLPDLTIQEVDVGEHYLTVQMSDFTRFMSASVIVPITFAEIVRVQGTPRQGQTAFAGGDAYFTFWISQAGAGGYTADLTQITSGTTGIRFQPSNRGTVQTFTASATQQRVMRGAIFTIQADGGSTDGAGGEAEFTITVRPRRQ